MLFCHRGHTCVHWSCQFGKRPTSIWQQSNGIACHQTKQKCFVRGTNDKLDPAQEANMEVLSGLGVVSLLTLELRNQLCNRCHHDYLPRSGIPSRIQMVVFHKSAGDPTIYTIYLLVFPGSINVSGTECHSVAYIISFVTTERSYHQLFCRNNTLSTH